MKNLIATITLFLLFITIGHATPSYEMIIDANSDGSHLHLYQYEKRNLANIHEIFYTHNKTSLSFFKDNPENAGESLQSILDAANIKMKTEGIKTADVPIQIIGTKEMRSLPNDKQEKIYDNVKNFIKNHYDFIIQKIETITAKTEAIYDWLDVNYLEEKLQSGTPTWGIIAIDQDMNILTTETNDTSKPDDEIVLTINGKKHILFVKNFSELNFEKSRVEMENDKNSAVCYPLNYEFRPNIKGNFNLTQCSTIYQSLLQKHDVISHIVPLTRPFVIFSESHDAYEFFGVEIPSQEALETRMYYVCSMTWEQLKREYIDSGLSEKYLSSICANGILLSKQIYDIYHLQESQLWVTDKINKQKINWPLGAVVFEQKNE